MPVKFQVTSASKRQIRKLNEDCPATGWIISLLMYSSLWKCIWNNGMLELRLVRLIWSWLIRSFHSQFSSLGGGAVFTVWVTWLQWKLWQDAVFSAPVSNIVFPIQYAYVEFYHPKENFSEEPADAKFKKVTGSPKTSSTQRLTPCQNTTAVIFIAVIITNLINVLARSAECLRVQLSAGTETPTTL
jgi:hypothetical protein